MKKDNLEKTENEIKKDFLRGYLRASKEVRRIEERLQLLRQMQIIPAAVSDGMPRGSGGCKDLSGYAAKRDELQREWQRARYRRLVELKAITARIDALTDEREREVLHYYYIMGLKWEEVCDKMGYSWRQTHYIHSSALKNFKIA